MAIRKDAGALDEAVFGPVGTRDRTTVLRRCLAALVAMHDAGLARVATVELVAIAPVEATDERVLIGLGVCGNYGRDRTAVLQVTSTARTHAAGSLPERARQKRRKVHDSPLQAFIELYRGPSLVWLAPGQVRLALFRVVAG